MSDAETDVSDAETNARSDAGHDARADARFGGLTPSEAAQRRWAGERARQTTTGDGDAGDVATDADIVRTLRRKAEKGDVAAARELREWRDREASLTQGDGWMAVLTAEERHAVIEIIERALARAG